MALFETEGIDEFSDAVEMIRELYPNEVKKFMRSEGTKLKNSTVKKAKSIVGKKAGNYEKGIKRGKYYKYAPTGADSIRVYSGKPAYHGHLIEYGHEMVTRSGKKVGRVQGYHIFKTAADEFEERYEKDSEKFADKILKPLDKG